MIVIVKHLSNDLYFIILKLFYIIYIIINKPNGSLRRCDAEQRRIYCIFFIIEMGENLKTSEISEILESICAQNELEWRKLNVRF